MKYLLMLLLSFGAIGFSTGCEADLDDDGAELEIDTD